MTIFTFCRAIPGEYYSSNCAQCLGSDVPNRGPGRIPRGLSFIPYIMM